MNERKSLLHHFGEAIDHYRAERRVETSQQEGSAQHSNRLNRLLRWLTPNGGTLLLIAALILTQNVWARTEQSPANAPGPSATTVNYQGRLADSGGAPLDGSYGMSFALYDALSGGGMVWGPENHTAVPVSEGLFSVGLGSLTGGGIPTSVWDGDRYLEITVGGETLSPRELIRSVPIAGMALTVPDGAIGSRHFAPSWYEDFNPQKISTTSTTFIPADTSVNFTCETDCTALILHRGLVQHSVVNGRVDVRIMVDDDIAFEELGVVNVGSPSGSGSSTFDKVSGFDFVDLSAGTHTVEVLFKCKTSGTCYYYGDANGWEQLNVLIFAQP